MEQSQTQKDRRIEMVVFELNRKEYGIPVTSTKEVIKLTEVVSIPNAPSFIAGVINLRGNIICVIDLRKQFDFSVANTEETRIMVVRMQKMIIGLIVDRVREVLKINRSLIDPIPPILHAQIPHHCLVGIAKLDERIITLLNLEKILSMDQLKSLNQQSISKGNESHG